MQFIIVYEQGPEEIGESGCLVFSAKNAEDARAIAAGMPRHRHSFTISPFNPIFMAESRSILKWKEIKDNEILPIR